MEEKFICQPGQCLAQTTKGIVRGFRERGVTCFRGIPYGKARRFHAPEEVAEWKGELDASSYGFVCPLINPNEKPHDELKVPHRYWPADEDCLNLNIWTPAVDDRKRPVFFWMHGGGFEAGSSIEQEAYDGYNMANRGDVVVVTVNHRLNFLGFLDLSSFGEEYENSANAGMEDLILALCWVRDNIEAFGGNPDNVTIAGQSGGGAKVTALLQMPEADGLYHRAVNMSGVVGPLLGDQKGDGRDFALALMKELDIQEVKELEEVDYELLRRAFRKVKPDFAKGTPTIAAAPKQNRFYRGDPVENGFRPETGQIPLLVGSVFSEFFSFGRPIYDRVNATREAGEHMLERFLTRKKSDIILPLFEEAYPERNPGDALTIDTLFRFHEIPYVEARAALNQSTYVYLFNKDFEIDGSTCPWHCSDIPFWFANTDKLSITATDSASAKLEGQMFDALMAFMKTGNPSHSALPAWTPAQPGAQTVMILDENPREKCNFDLELVRKSAEVTGPTVLAFMNSMRDKVLH